MTPSFASKVDASEFEPFDLADEDILEGKPNARIHWLRPEGHGSQVAGVFRCDPAAFRYTWVTDETIYVVKGRVRIEVDGEDAVDLDVGGIASFSAGDRGEWHVLEPFCEFFVLSA
jgi:uncharacterized cupin superfamily protein